MGTPKGTVPWNAGTSKGWVNARGYREIKVDGRNVKEHRVIMERHLGRALSPHELIHHKDGDKTNNAIDNLELIEWGEHSVMHHIGLQRKDSAKRTMQVFANLREENKRLRDLHADMLAALKIGLHFVKANQLAYGGDNAHSVISAAIAKAEGRN